MPNSIHIKCKELRKQGYDVQPDKELYISAWNEYRQQQIYVNKITHMLLPRRDK